MSIDVLPSCSSAFDSAEKSIHQQVYNRKSLSTKASSKYETTFVQNTVALAVISKLHKWCCQLFWLTILCVIGACGELNSSKRKTLQDVRRNIFNSNNRRCKTLTDLEMQVNRFFIYCLQQTTNVLLLRILLICQKLIPILLCVCSNTWRPRKTFKNKQQQLICAVLS